MKMIVLQKKITNYILFGCMNIGSLGIVTILSYIYYCEDKDNYKKID